MRSIFSMLLLTATLHAQAQCEGFEMTLTPNHPTCYNFTDGNIDVNIIGGTAPIHGTVTDENGTQVEIEKKKSHMLGGGWYYVYVVDGNGCELYDSVFLVNPPEMIAAVTVTDPGYPGACDGTAVVDTVLNYQGDYADISYFWIPGGPGGIGENVKTNLCDANYQLVINDAYGCSISESLAVGSVGISEMQTENNVQIFPNPATQFISLQSTQPVIRLTVSDLSGRLIMTIVADRSTEHVLDVSQLSNGVYQLRIELENGTNVITFVKD